MSLTNFMRVPSEYITLSEYKLDENFIACFKSQSEDVIWSLGLFIWLGSYFSKMFSKMIDPETTEYLFIYVFADLNQFAPF